MKCRHCASPLDDERDLFIDLGAAPPSNAFLRQADLGRPELHVPLKVLTCPECRLVQVDELQKHDALFSDDYVYFSSFSSSWLAHARAYVETVTDGSLTRWGLGTDPNITTASLRAVLAAFERQRRSSKRQHEG